MSKALKNNEKYHPDQLIENQSVRASLAPARRAVARKGGVVRVHEVRGGSVRPDHVLREPSAC